LHAADDTDEHVVFIIDYKKFAKFAQDLPSSRDASLTVASRLLRKVLPKSQNDSPWSVNTRTRDDVSVAGSEQSSPTRKKGKVLDAPPVTMINMDVLLECAWTAKRKEGLVADTTRALVEKENKLPHTVVFHDGEMVHWYFGWMSTIKRRSAEHLSNWQVLEDFCKGTEAGQIVAVMTCCKRGRTPGKEHAQCRLLDRRKLESILSGAKNNRLTGCLQKYQQSEVGDRTEYVLQCCWANTSFTVDWVPETMVGCFTLVHRPARMDPGEVKKLHEKMSVKYNQYVPGTMSELGDYFSSQVVKMNPLEQLDGRSKARARQFNDGTDTRAGNVVEREIRDTVKTACQQIAATFDKVINKSETARKKALDEAAEFCVHHSPAFTLLRSMTCIFKMRKDGCPSLIHCTAAIAHPETKQPLTAMARAELVDPKEETFLHFAGFGAEHSRLSGLGERALLLDFSEFLQLLTKKEMLYSHVSVTEASLCFKHACSALNAEEGQLKYPEYCECMRALRKRMGLNDQGHPKYQASNEESIGRMQSDAVLNSNVSEADIDSRLAGAMSVRRQMELERGRLGGMFAATIVEKMEVQDVERRAAERDRKHEVRVLERRKQLETMAAAQRKALEKHRRKATEQAAQRQQAAEHMARSNWEKIEERNQMIISQRHAEAIKRQTETESRRAASIEGLKMRRQAEEHRICEVTKRSELLETQRTKVYTKQKAVRESTKEYSYLAKREKEVVRDMYYDYVRTGHLAKPWGIIDLSGDALPSVIEIAAKKSKGHSANSDRIEGDNVAALLSVPGEKRLRFRGPPKKIGDSPVHM
jgi:phenylpyruvate tautomerase PptA (4-oxalocrotonate tautomerase family)